MKRLVLLFLTLLAFARAQDVSGTVTAGKVVTFTSVVQSGSPPLSYQWKLNGVAIPNATGAIYVTPPMASGILAGPSVYSLVVSNSVGSSTSNNVTLTVVPATVAPAFTLQPVSQTVVNGSTVSLSVVATGTPAPALQWFKNGAAISGATSASLALPNVTAADAATYTVKATNSAGVATSQPAVLAVMVVPAGAVITYTASP